MTTKKAPMTKEEFLAKVYYYASERNSDSLERNKAYSKESAAFDTEFSRLHHKATEALLAIADYCKSRLEKGAR